MKLKRKLLIITTTVFNKFTGDIFALRLKRRNLASNSHISNFVKKKDGDIKPKDVTSNKNELNQLSKKVKAISTTRSTKNLIDKFSILKGAKCFSLGMFQNYLVFIPAENTLNILKELLRLNHGIPVECQKEH